MKPIVSHSTGLTIGLLLEASRILQSTKLYLGVGPSGVVDLEEYHKILLTIDRSLPYDEVTRGLILARNLEIQFKIMHGGHYTEPDEKGRLYAHVECHTDPNEKENVHAPVGILYYS